MSGHEFVIFAVQIALMLACAIACGQLMRRFHQPAVLGEMLGGIVLGPTIFGALAPEWQAMLFPATGVVATVRKGTITLGMLFFLFSIGLEIDMDSLRRQGARAVLVGTIGMLVPLVCGVAMVYALPGIWGITDESRRLPLALFVGAALANSANPVLARILLDLGLLKEKLGAVLMAATMVDDLISWSLLAVIVGQVTGNLSPTEGQSGLLSSVLLVLVFFAVVLAFGRWVATPLLRWSRSHLSWPGGMLGAAIVILLLSAAAAEQLGIHAFLGPFLLGISLAPTETERAEAYGVIDHFVLSFFVPIYFVSMGLTANFIQDFDGRLVVSILLVACASKIASAFAAARLSGLDQRTSLAVGFGLNARGAIGIILANIGLENGIIDQPIYVALVVMALVTSVLAGPMMSWLLKPRA